MNRRLSYASVAAGGTARTSVLASAHSRTSSNDSNSTTGLAIERESYSQTAPLASSPPRNIDMASRHMQELDTPLREPSQLTHDWNNLLLKQANMALYGRHTQMAGNSPGSVQDRFIIPSYLRESKYMARAVRKLQQREATARREQADATLRPMRSSSSINLSNHRLSTGSHRGLTYEVVESRPPENAAPAGGASAEVAPLPTRWTSGHLETLAEGTGLRWPREQKGSESDAFRSMNTNHPVPVATGLYYYEVHIVHHHKGGHVAVGFGPANMSSTKLPGWEHRSWGWHSDDGKKYHGQQAGVQYGKEWGREDVVGCGVNFLDRSIFFTRNGVRLADAFTNIDKNDMAKMYPCIGMKGPGATLSVNFGQDAFRFDIGGEYKHSKTLVKNGIDGTKLSRLGGGRSEDDFVKELVAQFLRHGGYVETARAFVQEVQTEHAALGTPWPIEGNPADEDIDAAQRQQIRSAILCGDVQKAIRCTQDFYPQVLAENPIIEFRLKCRKFLEMVMKPAGRSRAPDDNDVAVSPNKRDKANATLPGASGAMDLDEPIGEGKFSKDRTAYGSESTPVDLNDVLAEGQRLQEEYHDHQNKEVREMMRHIMGIWAYEDPPKSKEVGHLFSQSERVRIAEELNGAILESMGKSSVAAIERMAQQTDVLVDEITAPGLPGAFVGYEVGKSSS